MVARLGKAPWYESFDVDAEVDELLAHIERCTGFALPERQRDVIMTHARAKLDRTRQAYLEAKAAGKPVSTSRRAYLTDLQDTIFMALSSSLKDMAVQDAQAFVSKLWHGAIDDNARKYAEALKRPEREIMPLRPGNTV
ncbi:hypothetical protein [Phaeobacter italicus]|uniref:hypothetical protein n=1 Tax=Phaeobacter italicus TaxID=481446 RepID=UPI002430C612|nr:hypothetical protein [Phaeobacter italicus]MCI5099897.1 hypothetical protein [Phaeobacter italicus]